MADLTFPLFVLGGVCTLAGYFAKQAHADILKRLDSQATLLAEHIADDAETTRTIAVQQATVVARLDALLERVREGR